MIPFVDGSGPTCRSPRCRQAATRRSGRRPAAGAAAVTLEHLILLRHGETDWNVERRHAGSPRHRAERGRPAAGGGRRAVRRRAAAAGDRVVRLWSRARDTARRGGASWRLPVAVDARLRETSMGDWEGLTRDDVVRAGRASGSAGAPRRPRLAAAAVSPARRSRGGPPRWSPSWTPATTQRALLVSHGGLIVGLTGRLLDAARRQLGDADRHRQLPLGDPAPVRRRLAAALLQRRARGRRAAARRGRGRRHLSRVTLSSRLTALD